MYSDDNDLVLCEDIFKKIFKYYKSNKPKPSLENVISVDSISNDNDKVTQVVSNFQEDPRIRVLGLQSQFSWRTFIFREHPGLLLIRNPFTPNGQRYWIQQCLEVYPKKPNKLNIDIETNLQDWWSECFQNGQCNRVIQKKLRWTTLGYHHNWDTKIYNEENKTTFPEDLQELSDVIANYLSYNFKAEAAIVNYYHMDSTLSAHTDHSEINLKAPLFSLSFGQSAIFLLGGKDKSTKPSAILLNSGDIVVMSEDARLCYHAVPKILPSKDTPWNDTDKCALQNCDPTNFKYLSSSDQEQIYFKMKQNVDNIKWSRFNTYIQESRINMNVRQVLNEKQNSLTDVKFNGT